MRFVLIIARERKQSKPIRVRTLTTRVHDGMCASGQVYHDGPRSIRFVLYTDELFHAPLKGAARPPMERCEQPGGGRCRTIGSVPLT